MNRQTRFYALAARYVALLSFLLLLSFSAFSHASTQKFSAQEIDEILYHIHTYYVEDLPLSRYNASNLSSLFDNLDPYSKYLNEDDLESIFSAANGRYTGLGIEVEEQDNYVIILDTLPNSPAAQAGIESGDKLHAINGANVAGKSIEEVSALLKAANKNLINLVVLRQDELVALELKRQEIVIESVASKLLNDGTGFLSVNSFNHHTYHDVARHINRLQVQLDSPLKKLVIDLRDNPGGTLNSAVAISDLFLDSGTIVTTKGRFYDANQAYIAKRGDILNGAPILVLINNNSASAAEILAAALKDNKRALVVGLRSYGKGSVQSLIPIGNGTTALKLTTARYYTPAGTSIEGKGIEPDVYFTKQALSLLDKSAIITGEESIKTTGIEQLASHWPKALALVQSQ
ncbi:S41 family peptidase [Pseudoalteromonas piscicida]|uniref:S41 family peptidase n=1 Tax=Pseudoalteromonas piscicida TaxID=43662 RepID=UPI000E35EDF5|nr:S41 family peptidase [Pseudoalteromonas piscicida]AXQ96892.1 S41 family peptidase [Pseudoalteromonas piscicida]